MENERRGYLAPPNYDEQKTTLFRIAPLRHALFSISMRGQKNPMSCSCQKTTGHFISIRFLFLLLNSVFIRALFPHLPK
jgi:hypothetical protein